MRRLVLRNAPVAALALVLTGCALGPDYERPETVSPGSWREAADAGTSLANLEWWSLFEDPQLDALIVLALEQNKDIAIAAARIEEARAQYGFVRADLFPRVDGRAGAARGTTPAFAIPGQSVANQFVLADLVVAGRENGASVFIRPDRERLAAWLQDYSVGELWEKNLLGGTPGRE